MLKMERVMFDPNTRILIVDELPTMRKLTIKSLKEIGLNDVMEASDVRKAWELITSSKPPLGLVLADVQLPGGAGGVDLLKRVRGDSTYKKLPFILITAAAEKPQVAEAVKAGVDSFLVKPVTTALLKEKLEAVHK